MPRTFTVESVLNTPDKELLIMNDEDFVAALDFLAEHLPKTGWGVEEFNAIELVLALATAYMDAVPHAVYLMTDHKGLNVSLKLVNIILKSFPEDDEEDDA